MLTTFALLAGTGQPDETLPGFKANQVYQSGGVDHVNLFSGDPGIVIPLGPEYPLSPGLTWQLRATYTSKIWSFDVFPGPPELRYAYLSGYPTLGAGWGLHLGFVDGGAYVSPTTGRHYFPLATGTSIANDGSGLRKSGNGSPQYTVEFPDGSKQVFGHQYLRPRPVPEEAPPVARPPHDFSDDIYPGDSPRWGLTAILDRFGKQVLTVEYLDSQTGLPTDAWKILRVHLTPPPDFQGLERIVVWSWGTWTNPIPQDWPVLSSLQFPTANGMLTVNFDRVTDLNASSFVRNDFDTAHLPGFPGYVPTDGTVYPPELAAIRINGADGQGGSGELAKYSFQYNGTGSRSNLANGTLQAMTLPTGGRISYTYGFTSGGGIRDDDLETIGCPPGGLIMAPQPVIGDSGPLFLFLLYVDRSAATATRTETVPGLTDSVTTYCRSQAAPPLPGDPTQHDDSRVARQIVVSRPDGNGNTIATRHIFSVEVQHNDGDPSNSGLELERRYYAESDVTLSPIRSLVFCYDSDGPSYTHSCGYKNTDGTKADFVGVYNIRRQNEATWYGVNPTGGGDCGQVGSPPCWQRSFSGWNATALEYATERTSSNSGILLYDDTGGTTTTGRYRDQTIAWTPNVDPTHWLLKLFSSKAVTDHFVAGTCPNSPCSVSTSYGFNSANGFLNSFSTTDGTYGTLTHSFTPDAAGNPAIETTTGSWPGAGSFVTNRTFLLGLPLTSVRAGLAVPWNGFDVSRDSATGLTTVSHDPNGLSTSYGYDALGRLTSAAPPGGEAVTTYCYQPWNSGTGQRAYALAKKGAGNSCSLDDGVPGLGTGSFEGFLFDGNGRVVREFRRSPNSLSTGGYFAFRETRYNAAGLVSLVGEWAPCPSGTNLASCFGAVAPSGTSYTNFDFLGRSKTVTLADGKTVTKSFDDPAAVPNSDFFELVSTDVGGIRMNSASRKDILGRLLLAGEPAPAPALCGRYSAYYYNVLDKLVSAIVPVGSLNNDPPVTPQTRTFTYDRLGLLRSETHPEKGTTTYTDPAAYDALGNLKKKTDGGIVYTNAYDVLGRLTSSTAGGVTYLTNVYDEALDGTVTRGWSLGRRTTAIAANPYPSSGFSMAFYPRDAITDSFFYLGLGGRLNQKKTTISNGSVSPVASWTYNSLGLVATEDYPRIDLTGAFSVATGYSSGLPTTVSASGQAIVTSASYNPAGGLASYTAGNGVTTTIDLDPNLMPRPGRIHTSDSNFDTGVYRYDGSGNILSIGTDAFAYDANSRLLSAWYSPTTQNYAYDAWGNLTQKAGVAIGVDQATNRLNGAGVSYDSRGNLTLLAGENYSYDALNRQARHDAPTSHWSYLLDGANERIVKAIPPTGPVARRDMARIILQAMGQTPLTVCKGYFSQDVSCADPERGWIEKFYEMGITAGCIAPPNGKFCANDTLTRWQMAVFISVAKVLPGTVPASGTVPGVGSYNCTAGGTSLFGDVLPTAVACRNIHYLYANGITIGCSVTPRLFCPNDTTPHDQMETLVSRAWNGFGYVPPGATYTFRGAGSSVLTEYQDSHVSKDYVYLGTRLVATNDIAAGWKYHVTDHLGSVRLTTNAVGAVLERRKYWPWGEEAGTAGTGRMAFAGMELDLEATRPRYYDHARSLETGNGRFLSPDLLSGKPADPQSWNRYTYARNNPLNVVDPDGRAGLGTVAYGLKQSIAAMYGMTPKQLDNYIAFAGGVAGVAAGVVGAAGGGTAAISSSVFELAPVVRGRVIESILGTAAGGSLPSNFPTIDRFDNGVATSVKSIDLLAKTYQSGAALLSKLTGYVDKLAGFNGGQVGRTVVEADQVTERVLEVVVPPGATAAQLEALQQAAAYAQTQNMTYRLIEAMK